MFYEIRCTNSALNNIKGYYSENGEQLSSISTEQEEMGLDYRRGNFGWT